MRLHVVEPTGYIGIFFLIILGKTSKTILRENEAPELSYCVVRHVLWNKCFIEHFVIFYSLIFSILDSVPI